MPNLKENLAFLKTGCIKMELLWVSFEKQIITSKKLLSSEPSIVLSYTAQSSIRILDIFKIKKPLNFFFFFFGEITQILVVDRKWVLV